MGKIWICVLIALALMAAFGVAGRMDAIERAAQERLYCEMVERWKLTGGREGWPPYNGMEVCHGN
jgi:hypothetical protein